MRVIAMNNGFTLTFTVRGLFLERHHTYFYHMSTRLNLHMHLTLPTLLYNYEHEGDRDVLN